MVQESGDIGSVVEDYGFVELPSVVKGHRNFILKDLVKRYADENGKYVIILHQARVEHFILGIHHDLREALQARYISNFILRGGNKFTDNYFVQVHDIDGPVIDDKVYDAENDTVKDFEVEDEG